MPKALPALILTALLALAMAAAATGRVELRLAAGLALMAFLLQIALTASWREVPLLAGTGISAAAVAMLHAEPPAVLAEALARGAGYTAIILALSFLQAPAAMSTVIRRAGAFLLQQAPGRRYLMFTLGGHIFGVLLNVAGVFLLGGIARDSNTLEAARGDLALQRDRERRMATALLRGFSTVALWSPNSFFVPIVLSLVPLVSWDELAPIGLAIALALMAIGWTLDHWTRRGAAPEPAAIDPDAFTGAILPLLGLMAAIVSCAVVVKFTFDWSLDRAVIVATPFVAALWLLAQRLAAPAGQAPGRSIGAELWSHCMERLPRMRYETMALGAGGFIGTSIGALVPPAWLAAAIHAAALPPVGLLIALVVVVLVLGHIGVSPVITLTVFGAALAQLDTQPVPPLALAVAMLWSCSLYPTSSPIAALSLLLAQFFRQSPARISFGWNMGFNALSFAFMVPVLMLLA